MTEGSGLWLTPGEKVQTERRDVFIGDANTARILFTLQVGEFWEEQVLAGEDLNAYSADGTFARAEWSIRDCLWGCGDLTLAVSVVRRFRGADVVYSVHDRVLQKLIHQFLDTVIQGRREQ